MKYKNTAIGLILLVWLLPSAAAIAHDQAGDAIERSADELYDQIMCPICPGQTIAQSTSESSRQMRDLVLKKLRQGETREQVLAYFASRYGERILAKPNKKGLNLMLWLLPFVLFVFAAILIQMLIRRWSLRRRLEVEEDSHLQDTRLSEYEERLEKELKEFEDEF